jgi:hypothetical protein
VSGNGIRVVWYAGDDRVAVVEEAWGASMDLRTLRRNIPIIFPDWVVLKAGIAANTKLLH